MKYNILLIEDNKSHAKYIASVLNPKLYNVKTLYDGKQGYDYLLSPEIFPDAIIVDNYMPYMEGTEIIEYFVEHGYDYGFIILTGNSSIDLAVKALKLGALNYIAKSLDIKKELEIIVEKTIKQNRERIEKKQIEKQLIESEDRFKKHYKNIPIPTYTWKKTDDDFVLIDYNNSAIEVTQGKIKNFINAKATTIFNKNKKILERLNNCYTNKQIIQVEEPYTFQTTNERKIIKSTYVNISDDLIMVHTEDITARKKAEQQLTDTYRQLKTVFETIPAAINVIDNNLNVIECNDQMLKLYKVKSKNDIIGKKCISYCNLDKLLCKYCNIPDKTTIDGLFIRITKTSEYLDNHIYKIFSKPIKDQNNNSLGIVEVIVDITDEKLAEKQLKELNITKDKLFSIIGHDLRGPIGNFKALIELLISGYDLTDTKNLLEILKGIQTSANATYELLENLLSWAKSQRNEIVFTPEILKLKTLVIETISLFDEITRKKQISIINNFSENISVYADKNMLMTVLRNLISNAIKFTPHGKNIHILVDINETETIITVKDEGIGIKKDDISKLFKTSEYFTTYGTDNEKGSGLGLLLCKDLIEKHNGKIWVESELDKGSDFICILPNLKTQ